MATPSDREPSSGPDREAMGRMGEGYFILGMAVQVGLVGLVGLALVGVQGLGFISLGTAVALAGLAIGVLAVGTILTLASLRHTLNVLYDHDDRIDRVAERVGRLAQEVRGDEAVGWKGEEMDLTAHRPHERAPPSDPQERRPEPGPGSPPDPLQHEPVHPIVDVPGIDEDQAERLADLEVEDTDQLRARDTMYLAGQLQEQPGTVRRWQATADLMTVEGVGGEQALMMAEASLGSVDELAHESPERLMARIEEADVGESAPPVGPQQADRWIQAARRRQASTEEREA
jgi:hypothetical protein